MKGSSPLDDAVTHSDAGRRPSIDATRRLQQLSVKTSLSVSVSLSLSTSPYKLRPSKYDLPPGRVIQPSL